MIKTLSFYSFKYGSCATKNICFCLLNGKKSFSNYLSNANEVYIFFTFCFLLLFFFCSTKIL